MFTQAIVRVPGRNFDQGLSTGQLGVPRFEQVLQQHAATAMRCGDADSTSRPWSRISSMLTRRSSRTQLC